MNATPETWVVTNHAAKRYCERVDRRLRPEDAARILESALQGATFLELSSNEQQRWLLPSGKAIVIASPNTVDGARIAITVLGPDEMMVSEETAAQDVVDAFRRSKAAMLAAELPIALRIEKQLHHSAAIGKVTEPAPKPPGKAEKSSKQTAGAAEHIANLKNEIANLKNHAANMTANAAKWKALLLASQKRPFTEDDENSLKAWKERALTAEKKAIEISREPTPRQKQHMVTMMTESTKRRDMLRVAVVALREAGNVEALASLEAMSEGVTGDHFCYPERFTKEERKAAAASREAKEQGT